MEIDHVEPPASNCYMHLLISCDVMSGYLIAVPVQQLRTSTVTDALSQFFAQHANVPKHLLTDKGSAFTAQILYGVMNECSININHSTLKHAQAIGMSEQNHQNLKQILKNIVAAGTPH